MDSIPLELKTTIVDGLEDKADFLACRLVSKSLKAVATSRAFRVIKLVPEENSIQVIQNLVASPDLSFHVKEIVYFDTEGQDFDNLEAMTATTSCFLHLSKFQNLVTLRLQLPDRFSELYEHEASCNGRLQTAVFETLATSTPPKKSRCLDIVGILALPHYSVHLPGFAEFLKPIQTLRLVVASDHSSDYQSVYGNQLYNRFWTSDISVFLKSPTSLTNLTIFSDRDHLYPDHATWDSLSFPNLTTLQLRDICFYGPSDTGAEGFIVRHAASLTTLWISNCMIANYGHDSNPKISAAVLYHFQEKLKNLKDFTLFPTPGQLQANKSRVDIKYFAHLIGGQGYQALLDDNQSGTDMEIYQTLQNAVNSGRQSEEESYIMAR